MLLTKNIVQNLTFQNNYYYKIKVEFFNKKGINKFWKRFSNNKENNMKILCS